MATLSSSFQENIEHVRVTTEYCLVTHMTDLYAPGPIRPLAVYLIFELKQKLSVGTKKHIDTGSDKASPHSSYYDYIQLSHNPHANSFPTLISPTADGFIELPSTLHLHKDNDVQDIDIVVLSNEYLRPAT